MFELNALPSGSETSPPVEPDRLCQAESQLGLRLPDDLRQFFLQSDGLVTKSHGQILFDIESLLEMNEAHEVQRRLPGTINIGSDGEGNAILMQSDGFSVGRCDYGSLGLLDPTPVAESFSAWFRDGFRLPPFAETNEEIDWSAPADLVLVSPPSGGLKDLMALRTELAMNTGVAELNQLTKRLPAVLPVSLTYGQAKKRCDRLGEVARCLEVRLKE